MGGLVIAMAACCCRDVKPRVAYLELQQVLMPKEYTCTAEIIQD